MSINLSWVHKPKPNRKKKMLDKLFSVIATIFVVTAIGIALRPGAPTANIIKAFGDTLVGAQKAAYGASTK
jgi:hypothetical protein